jgi:hypothetical protein
MTALPKISIALIHYCHLNPILRYYILLVFVRHAFQNIKGVPDTLALTPGKGYQNLAILSVKDPTLEDCRPGETGIAQIISTG